MSQAQMPFDIYTDSDGSALENGSIYIGTVSLNPETNPIAVYWDSALTQLAAQPLRTSGGYIWRNGAPSRIYLASDTYSITVRDRRGILVWSVLDSTTIYNSNSAISQISTGHFYYGDGARINRLNDRTFFGAASINDGNVWSGATGNQDYVSQNITNGPSTALAQIASLNTTGGIGGMFASRSSDSAGAPYQGTLGVVGVGINDYTPIPVIAQGGYFEAQRKTNAGITYAVEIDIVNQGSAVSYNPYSPLSTASLGYTSALALASGGARSSPVVASSAITIHGNGSTFSKGIVFASSALDGNNEAIAFSQGHIQRWWSGTYAAFGTAGSATLGSNIFTFTATAYVPVVGMLIGPSDIWATFPEGTYITQVDSPTQVRFNANAIKSTAGMTMSATFPVPTAYIQSLATNTSQPTIIFGNTEILLGSCPATNGGSNCAGVLSLRHANSGANYITMAASVAGTPTIATNANGLTIGSATGAVNVGNTEALPTVTVTTTQLRVNPTTAMPAGGSIGVGLTFSSTAQFGIFYGSGVPTLSAAQGSLYLRTDGTTTNNRMYVNTNGAATWTAVTTVA